MFGFCKRYGWWSPAAIGLGRRAFLLVLLLAAGQAAVLPEASAQATPSPLKWSSSSPPAPTYDVTTTSLVATRTQQSVTVEITNRNSRNYGADAMLACTWTVVEPATKTGTSLPSGCTVLVDKPHRDAKTLTANITPTQAMITNGGVVIAMVLGRSSHTPAYNFYYAEWIPLVVPLTLALAPATITENGGIATVTATQASTVSTATTVTVTAVEGAYTVGADATIVIAAGSTTNAADTVTIQAVDNATDEPDRMVDVTGTASSTYMIAVTTAELTLTDDDAAPGVTLALAPTSIAENAGTTTVTAALTHPSSAATTVTLAAAAGAYTVGADTTIVIAAGDTANTADTVVLTGEDNATDAPDRTVTVPATAANAQGVGTVTGAELTLTDDDAGPGATLTLMPATVAESGGVATVTAALSHPSSAATTVTVTPAAGFYTVGADATIVIAAGATVNAADTATVAAVDDAADTPDRTATVTGTLANSQGAGAVTGATLTLTDDDTRGITLDTDPADPGDQTASLAVTEGHATLGSAAYTVRLATRPVGGDVTVTVAGSPAGAVTVRPAPLLFTASNWNTARTVTATAADDQNSDNENVTLTHTAVGGDYPATPPVTAALTVDVTDDDVPGLTVSGATLEIAEGAGTPSTGQYTVRLNTNPQGTVTVGIAEPPAAANADIAASPTALTFDASTWATGQAVTVTAQADADAADDTTTLRHAVTGSGATAYPTTLTAVDVMVRVRDADEAGVTLSETALMLTEEDATEGSKTYTVVLDTEPTAAVTVTVESPDAAVVVDTDLTPRARELTFTAADWNMAQTVTATAAADLNGVHERVLLTHTLTGAAEYAGVSVAPVTVQVTDDDPAGLVVDTDPGTMGVQTTALAVNEGAQVSYTVRLATQPTADVGVKIQAAHADVALQAAGSGAMGETVWLTFRPGPVDASLWNTAQTVTVHALPNADMANATARLEHEATGGDYGAVTASLEVTVTDVSTTIPSGSPVLPAIVPSSLTFRERQRVRVQLPAATMGDAPLTYTLTPALPAGLAYDAMRRIVGAATAVPDPAMGTYTHTVTDADGQTATQTVTVTIEENPRPQFDAPAPRYTSGETYTLPAPTVADNERLVFAVTPALPAGLVYTPPPLQVDTIEGVTSSIYRTGGTITGTPEERLPTGRYTLTVTDADGDMATLGFRLAQPAVLPPPDLRPSFGDARIEAQTYMVGTAITPLVLPAATGGDGTLSYAVTPDLPPGLTYTAPADATNGGTISGTPTEERAAATYTLTATDRDGDPATLPFTLTVEPDLRPRFEAVVIDRTYVVGTAIAPLVLPAAMDGTLSYTPPPDLPPGLTYTMPADAASGGTIAGTPTEARDKTTYTLTAMDADGDVTTPPLPFALTVEADVQPSFGEAVVPPQILLVQEPMVPVLLPRATGGNGALRYTLTPELPDGLTSTLPTASAEGRIAGTPTVVQAAATYTLTVTDVDGDPAMLPVSIEVVRIPVQVTLKDATATEGGVAEFALTLSRAVPKPLTFHWTAGRPGNAAPGDDYQAETAGRLRLAAGTTAGRLRVPTIDDRRVEPVETFTVTVTLPGDPIIEATDVTAEGRIEDDDTEQARKRSLGMVLAGVGRTLATDAVDVIGERFIRQPTGNQVTVGGQALNLHDDPQAGRWRQAAGVAYGVARALGVEVGSPLAGGDGQFGQVRGAAWHTLTRHLNDPHGGAAPLSAWDTPGAFAGGLGDGPGGRLPAGESLVGATPFGSGVLPAMADDGPGLGQRGFDRAHAATPHLRAASGTLRNPVRFRRVAATELLAQSRFAMPLGEEAAEGWTSGWTLWGRGTASGFDGKPKDDFSMDGNVFTGYLGLDYRLQPNVLLGLAVAHSQGDVDYETTDVTKGAVDLTLTSVLPYAHWSPRPGLGVWGLFGAGWGDLKLRDEAGKVKTDLEMLMAAVGARQEVLTWRRIDVALKADAFLTELEAGSDDRLPQTAGDAQRLRLMVEGRTAWAVSEDSHLTPIFEVGGRWDGGKAETGVGAELGGGFEYVHTKLGLRIEARGRYLLAHQKSAFDEWGASLTLKLDPGEAKRGLWLAVAPVWGAEASQVEQMWGSADVLQAGAETDTPPGLSPAQVEFDIGYGLVTHEGAGLLTTYGGLSMAGPQNHGYRLGGRIELGEWIDLSVEGERTTQAGGAAHQVALYGHLGW